MNRIVIVKATPTDPHGDKSSEVRVCDTVEEATGHCAVLNNKDPDGTLYVTKIR